MRKRLVDYWWLWAALALIAIVGNEVVDRGTDSGSHPVADLLIAVAAVALAASIWEFVARRRSGSVS